MPTPSPDLPDLALRLYRVADSMDYVASLQAEDKSIGPWLQLLACVISDYGDEITNALPERTPELQIASGEKPNPWHQMP